MPEKDGSDDKKSTKSVVSKKQKQFMNKEQLDLTSVAESFGGKIVGEPVELDEFKTSNPVTATVGKTKVKTGIPVVDAIITGGALGWQTGKWLDKLITPKLNPLPKYKTLKQFQDIKKYEKKDGVTKLYTDKELETKKKNLEKKNGYTKLYSDDELLLKKNALQNKEIKKKENNVIKRDMVDPNYKPPEEEIKKIKPNEKTVTTPEKEIKPNKTTEKPEITTKPKEFDKETKVNINKVKNIDKNKNKIVTTNKNDLDTKKDSKTNLSVLPLPSKQKLNQKTKLKTKTGKPFRLKGLGLPTTPHNVGRRTNPQ